MAEKPFNTADIMVDVIEDLETVVRQISLSVLTRLTFATPVGDPNLWKNPRSAPPGYSGGHARRNWQVGIGVSKNIELKGSNRSPGPVITRGKLELKRYRNARFKKVFVTNNVPYINRLNNGHSRQAPAGFVEQAIAVSGKGIRRLKIL